MNDTAECRTAYILYNIYIHVYIIIIYPYTRTFNSLLHVLLGLEHVDLPLPLQLVLILRAMPLVLRLGVERLAGLLGLLLDVGAAHLLGVRVHLGPLGGCLVLKVVVVGSGGGSGGGENRRI